VHTNTNVSFLDGLPKPEPSAGLEFYSSERTRALELSPKKKDNHAKYIKSNRRSKTVDYLPIKLDIENVSRCNYACTMCIVSTWDNGRRASDMSLEEFKNIIDEQYGLVEIKLNGLGEPLLQGDDYFEMIKYARKQHIWVRITTNASLLHIRQNYKKLIDSDVNEIDISIDGSDKETYENIRRKGNFEQVKDNCRMLNAYTKELGIVRTKMWTVVQESNYKKMPQLVELASELGFTKQVFSLNMHGWGDGKLADINRKLTVDHKLDEELLSNVIKLGEKLGVHVMFWTVNDKFDRRSIETLCPWPFERAVVTSDMRTVPCCMIGNPDAFEIARGSNKTFGEIWFSEEYEEFRLSHLRGSVPGICASCYLE